MSNLDWCLCYRNYIPGGQEIIYRRYSHREMAEQKLIRILVAGGHRKSFYTLPWTELNAAMEKVLSSGRQSTISFREDPPKKWE